MTHEDKRIEPRVKEIMKWQFRFIFINFFAAIFGSWAIAQLLISPDAHPIWFGLASGVGAWVLIRVLNFITLLVLQTLYYGLDTARLVQDAEEASAIMNGKNPPPLAEAPQTQQLEFNVVKKARKPLGRFMDHYFYEWIEVSRGGQRTRLYFDGTIDLNRATIKDIPGDCLILPPGIIYKAQ